jgi:NAD+ diphosphatase
MLFYPRLSPAVIVLVKRGDRILLARSPGFPPGMYSVLAGFVEPGESIEEAISREVCEEVGVEVENVRYFGSQPWPFPHSLMIGFTADYAGGELRVEPDEIEDAGWFEADDLPAVPPRISIARAMIDAFVAQRDRDYRRTTAGQRHQDVPPSGELEYPEGRTT